MVGNRNFQKRFHNLKTLCEMGHYGHGIIVPEYARDKFKKNSALKWYIIKRGLRYTIITEEANACSTSMESEIRNIKQAISSYLEMKSNSVGEP